MFYWICNISICVSRNFETIKYRYLVEYVIFVHNSVNYDGPYCNVVGILNWVLIAVLN